MTIPNPEGYRGPGGAEPIRHSTAAALLRYVNDRIEPGHFLTACLENNLKDAIGRADEQNLAALPSIVCWLYNEVPGGCWGSPENVKAWLSGEVAP